MRISPVLALSILLGLSAAALGQSTRPSTVPAEVGIVPTTRPQGVPVAGRPEGQPAEVEGTGRAVYAGGELLRDYDPIPAMVVPRHLIDKPKFPVIDAHCHWSVEQDPRKMLADMDALGIDRAVNLSGGYGDDLDAMLRKFHDFSPRRFVIFCNLDFSTIDEPDWSQRMVKLVDDANQRGVRGLKIFKSLGLTIKDKNGTIVPIDDPRLDPVWAECGKLKMPVLIHSGDPVAFFQPIDRNNERWMQLKRHPDWSFYGPDFPPREVVIQQRNHIVQKHPETIFIGAHVANDSEDLAKVSAEMDKYPNLYADISGRVSELGRQPYTARAFLIKYQDRILFGTDRYPGRPDQPRYKVYYRFLETADQNFYYFDNPFPPNGDWRIYGVDLPGPVLEKIYHGNYDKLVPVGAGR